MKQSRLSHPADDVSSGQHSQGQTSVSQIAVTAAVTEESRDQGNGENQPLPQHQPKRLQRLFPDSWRVNIQVDRLYKRLRKHLPLRTSARLERLCYGFTGSHYCAGRIHSLGLTAEFCGPVAAGFQTAGVIQTAATPESQDNRVDNGIILQPTGDHHSSCESRQPVYCDVSGVPWPVSDRFTPLGYHVALTDRFAAISTIPGGRAPLAPSGQPASLLHVPDLAALRARPDTWRMKLQKFTGLLDRPDNHLDPRLRAAVLTHAAAVGLPVCLSDDSGLRGFLPDEVLDLWRSTIPSDLRNPDQRDRIAFRQWSAVLDSLSMRSTWNRLLTTSGKAALRPRRISVLAVTKRPKMLPFWAQLLAAQDYPDFEVIAGFHGSAFTRQDESRARNWLGDRLTVLRASDDCPLGEVLNQVTAAASGELIVKWDDDDLYSSGHLSDLARMYEYSGATMVGKAAEFVYLAASNMTIRHSRRSSELMGFRMSGNTLCLPREELLRLGGWQPVPRSVDTRLIREIIRRGGQLYRGIGFGHLVLRSPHNDHDHTWVHPDREMMRYCRDQRPGLDTDFAMVDVPAELLARWPNPRKPAIGQESGVA